MKNKRKLSGMIFLGAALLLLAACSPSGNQNARSASSSQTSQPSGAMDASRIQAPQVGLSDSEWNQSRGTVSDGKDTNSENAPTRIFDS